MENNKSGKTKYILSILFLVVLIVATFVVITIKYDVTELLKLIKQSKLRWLGLGVVMIFVYIYFEGLAMRRLFKSMSLNVSRTKNFAYSAIDYYFCAVTPSASGGQPMVAYYMAKDKIGIEKSSLVLLVNTALFKIVLIVLSLISLIFCHDIVFDSVILTVLFFVGIIINVFLITLCFLVAFKRSWVEAAGAWLIKLLFKMRIVKKPIKWLRAFGKKMDEYEVGAKHIKAHKKDAFLALMDNFIQRIAFFSIAFFVYLAFKYAYPEVSGFGFMDLFGIQVLVALSVDSLPLPGGAGISEYLYVIMFGAIYGINGNTDLVGSAMLLTRAVNFYIPLIVTGTITIIKQAILIKNGQKRIDG